MSFPSSTGSPRTFAPTGFFSPSGIGPPSVSLLSRVAGRSPRARRRVGRGRAAGRARLRRRQRRALEERRRAGRLGFVLVQQEIAFVVAGDAGEGEGAQRQEQDGSRAGHVGPSP